MLHYLSCIIEIAERRNTAVSKLYFDVFGETNGDVQLLSELTDPWRRWAEQLTAHRDRAERTFTHSLDRASRNKKLGLEELQTSVGLQHLTWVSLTLRFKLGVNEQSNSTAPDLFIQSSVASYNLVFSLFYCRIQTMLGSSPILWQTPSSLVDC